MTQAWTITNRITGEVLCPMFVTPSTGAHPKDYGWAWDATQQKATQITAMPDPAIQIWSGGAWIEDPAKVEAQLLPLVKTANENRVRDVYSMNYGKQKKYARKQQEVLDYRGLANTIALQLVTFLGMTPVNQLKKFRFAMAEAKARGITTDKVIDGWETAIDATETKVANWEAVEMKAIIDIKAAPTAAAKRAAYAAINWNWSA
jgi:hypothetical protein